MPWLISLKVPYRDVNVPLPVYNDTAWDGAMAHNPYAITVGGKY
jgi:hypothetical protein